MPLNDPAALEEWYRKLHEIGAQFQLNGPVEGLNKFRCGKCHDRSWLKAVDGSMIPCPQCSAYSPVEGLKTYAGVPQNRWKDTFETFDLKRAPKMREAVQAALEFVSGASAPWLVIAGPIGCGKTHLAYAVANRMAGEGWKVRLWPVPQLLDSIRETFNRSAEGKGDYKTVDEMAYDPSVLILDDLGAEKGSDWVTEELFKIIDRRYREGKGLMVTINESFSVLSPRLQSRFSEPDMCRIVVCDSPDFRPLLVPRRKGGKSRDVSLEIR